LQTETTTKRKSNNPTAPAGVFHTPAPVGSATRLIIKVLKLLILIEYALSTGIRQALTIGTNSATHWRVFILASGSIAKEISMIVTR
jgi:hypothetical protein